MCSHDAHGMEGMVFPNWSALRAHVKTEHPPTCPFEGCNVSFLCGMRGFFLIAGLRIEPRIQEYQESKGTSEGTCGARR